LSWGIDLSPLAAQIQLISGGVSAPVQGSQVSRQQGLVRHPASPSPLRILKVTQSYFPFLDRGGPAMKVRAMARGLVLRGHQVTVLTTDLGLQERGEGLAFSCSPWGWRSTTDDVETFYLRPRGIYRSLTWNPAVYGFSREQVSSFDLVHIYGLYDLLAPPVARVCRKLGIPYIVEPIGMFRPIVRSIALKRVYQRLFGDTLIRGARRVVATSLQEQNELIGGGVAADKIVIRRNGIESPEPLPARGSFRRQWSISEDAQIVLYLGRLVSKKSPDLLLEAFARCRERSARSTVLVLAGPDEGDGYRGRLEARAKQLGMSAQVLFTGPLYDQAKWTAYRDADLFVLPSQSENFGNTAAEAVACGTPVLLTDRCGVAAMIDGRAGLAVPYEREALAAGLAQLLSDSPLQQRLRNGCAVVAAELGWAEPLDETETLYAALAGGKAHSTTS
jgi:glycosyltransferase involved in cell wall biosynthesis